MQAMIKQLSMHVGFHRYKHSKQNEKAMQRLLQECGNFRWYITDDIMLIEVIIGWVG